MGGGSSPPPPPRLPEAPRTADTGTAISKDMDAKRRRAASGAGSSSTILTSPRGVTNGTTGAAKTLLGQ